MRHGQRVGDSALVLRRGDQGRDLATNDDLAGIVELAGDLRRDCGRKRGGGKAWSGKA